MMAALLQTLAAATLVSTVAILAAFLLRGLARRWLDARLAYSTWLLVPLALLAVAAPQSASLPLQAIEIPLPTMEATSAAMVAPMAGQGAEASAWMALWLAGALLSFAWLACQQAGFRRRLGPLSPATDDDVFHAATPSPVLMGLFNPKVILPSDAGDRYGHHELELIVAHERIHARRGDLWANALAAAMQVAFWFNPLVHLAIRCFRYDQELACDEAVLAQFPGSRKAYANAILKTQLSSHSAPLAANWRSDHPLKGRMMNMNANKPSCQRRTVGKFALAAILAGACSGVWAYANAPQAAGAKFDVSAKFVLGSEPERAVLLKGVDVPGAPLKLTSDAGCEYRMQLAQAGSSSVRIEVDIHCAGKRVAQPKLEARLGDTARVEMNNLDGQKFSMSVTVTKADGKATAGPSTSKL
jgi:beta-lactamase regulating signal transducer with metallopeptidase domain